MSDYSNVTHAITILDPWAYLIAAGFKTVENRKWSSTFRGPVAIHTSKSTRELERGYALSDELSQIHPAIHSAFNDNPRVGLSAVKDHPDAELFKPGAIIGVATVVDCIPFRPSADDPDDVFAQYQGRLGNPYGEIPIGEWASGRFCFVLANPVRFRQPILTPGKLNFWQMSRGLASAVSRESRNLITDPGEPANLPLEVDPLGGLIASRTVDDVKAEKKQSRAKAAKADRLLGGSLPQK